MLTVVFYLKITSNKELKFNFIQTALHYQTRFTDWKLSIKKVINQYGSVNLLPFSYREHRWEPVVESTVCKLNSNICDLCIQRTETFVVATANWPKRQKKLEASKFRFSLHK